jgi:hypothetical protein
VRQFDFKVIAVLQAQAGGTGLAHLNPPLNGTAVEDNAI